MPRRFIYPASPIGASAGASTKPTEGQIIYFQDDFESGNLSKWDSIVGGANVTASSENPHQGTYSLRVFYEVPVGPTDNNRYVRKSINPNLEHCFARAYVYHKSPQDGGEKHNAQRKVFYFLSSLDTSGWWLFLTSDSQADGGLTMRVSTNDSNYGGSAATVGNWDAGDYFWDTYVCCEMETRVNTPGLSDGVVRVWFDGTLRIEATNCHIRGTDTGGLQNFRFGAQLDINDAGEGNEYRYIDQVVIASSYVGL